MLARRKDRLLELDLPDTICEKVDITNIDAIREAVQKAEDKFGPVDCLINNAGIMLLGLVWEQDPSEWQRMVDINVVGLLNGIHVVLKDMIERQKSTIEHLYSGNCYCTFSKALSENCKNRSRLFQCPWYKRNL